MQKYTVGKSELGAGCTTCLSYKWVIHELLGMDRTSIFGSPILHTLVNIDRHELYTKKNRGEVWVYSRQNNVTVNGWWSIGYARGAASTQLRLADSVFLPIVVGNLWRKRRDRTFLTESRIMSMILVINEESRWEKRFKSVSGHCRERFPIDLPHLPTIKNQLI